MPPSLVRTLTQLMADALVSLIERERGARSPRRLALPVFHGDGLHEGVDINRSATVLERMERGADAPLP